MIGQSIQKRKGFIHTLEATFIAVIILTFVLGILPAIEKKENIRVAKDSFQEGLSNLDKRDILRNAVYASPTNLSRIQSELSSIVTKRVNFTVGVTIQNTTEGTITVNELVSEGYRGRYTYSPGNAAIESAFLTLTFETNDDADFYLNTELIGIRDTTSNLTVLDLSDRLVNSTNTFEIIIQNQQNVTRKLATTTTTKLAEPPAESSVNVVTYFTSGINSTYDPREIRVYIWNE